MTKAEIIKFLLDLAHKRAEKIKALSADRDTWKRRCKAAEKDICHHCSTCQYHHIFFNGNTYDHECTNPYGVCSNDRDRWHWRGPCEENRGGAAN